jgi:SLOG in TRPM, prokaryote
MTTPFAVRFAGGRTARIVKVVRDADLADCLSAIGLQGSGPAMVVVGGAAGLSADGFEQLRPVFREALASVAQRVDAFVIDGGTDVGVMRLLGRARSELGASFPLIGVAALGTVTIPGEEPVRSDAAPLEPHHSHFLLVPGDDWGDESRWLAAAASALAGAAPSVTILVNGGQVTYDDVAHSVAANRPTIVVAGSGRTADQLVAAVDGEATDERALALVASGLVQVAGPVADPDSVAAALSAVLSPAQGPPASQRNTD